MANPSIGLGSIAAPGMKKRMGPVGHRRLPLSVRLGLSWPQINVAGSQVRCRTEGDLRIDLKTVSNYVGF